MPTMPFVLPSNERAVTWTLAAGTSVGGDYVLAALTDGNPELPLWIAETTIDLRGDQLSALRVDAVVLVFPNFQAATTLRLQMHADTATWAGATSVDLAINVPAWQGRWPLNVCVHVAATFSEAARTQRYLRLTNLDANDVPIQIGEIVVCGVISELRRGIRVQPRTPLGFGRSLNPSRAGVATVHDARTRARSWIGGVALETSQAVTDEATFRAWQDDSYGVRPFVVWPLNDIGGEPIYGRFASPAYDPTHLPPIVEAPFAIEELSCGEAY